MNPPSWFTDIAHIQTVVDAIMGLPLIMIFQEGEVYGTFQDFISPRFQNGMARKLKGFVEIKPFTGNHQLLEGRRLAYMYYEHSSRKKAYRKRMTLKTMFPKHRTMLLYTRQMSQKEFLLKIKPTPEILRVLKHNGFKTLKYLWQVSNNPKLAIPNAQKSLTQFYEVRLHAKSKTRTIQDKLKIYPPPAAPMAKALSFRTQRNV